MAPVSVKGLLEGLERCGKLMEDSFRDFTDPLQKIEILQLFCLAVLTKN